MTKINNKVQCPCCESTEIEHGYDDELNKICYCVACATEWRVLWTQIIIGV